MTLINGERREKNGEVTCNKIRELIFQTIFQIICSTCIEGIVFQKTLNIEICK